MMRLSCLLVAGIFLFLLSFSHSYADSSEQIEELKEMIEQNRKQNEALMQKIEELENNRAADQQKLQELTVERQEEDEKLQGLVTFFDSIDLSFYVDTTYQYVFDKRASDDVQLRPLYPENEQFSINAFTISLGKTPSMDGGVFDLLGFRADILFGQQAGLLASQGLSGEQVDPYQGYLQFLAPVGTGINFYAGKFVTLAGYEVIEAKNNPNITRSILFGFAIPFTHVGIRSDYTAGPVTFTAGVNNGWDLVEDNNDNMTIESQIAFSHSGGAISDSWFGLTGYFGKEVDNVDIIADGWREVITAVGSITLNDWLTFVVDADFGWQQDLVIGEAGETENVSWWGVAGYIVADVHPAVTLSLRGEYFDDSDGFRTGTEQTLYEVTPTVIFKPFKGLIAGNRFVDNFEARAEFRWDHSDTLYFETKDDTLKKDQYGLMAQLLYWIDL